MKTLKIHSAEFIRGFKIKNINEEDPVVDQIMYITLELYKQVCRRVRRSRNWEYYTETRAYFIGRTLEKILRDDLKLKIEQIRNHQPITYEAIVDGDRKISCKVEFGSHKHFLEKGEAMNYIYLEDLKINYGFCSMKGTSTKRIWPLRPKGNIMNLWVGIKTTDPMSTVGQVPMDPRNIFEATIHEFVHVLDNVERYFDKQVAFEFTKPILEKVLNEFFIFKNKGD